MSTATDIIQDARNYASTTYDNADDLINAAQSRISITTPNNPNSTIPDINIDDIEYDEVSEFNDRYVAPISVTEKPVFQPIDLPGKMETVEPIDDFDKSKLWVGDVPLFNLPDFDKTAPSISPVVFPDAPEYFPVPYPDIEPVDVPVFKGVVIPTFTPEMLATLPDSPGDIVKEYKQTYKDSLPEMKAFLDSGVQSFLTTYAPEYESNRAQLMDRINQSFNGGTGLSETFEQNLYDRGRAKAEQEQIRITTEIQENADKRGHFVPDGSVIAGLVKAQSDAAMVNAQFASETTIERAKLELNHLEFIMGLSNNIRDTALQMVTQQANILLQVNAQALKHGKTVANTMVELYNLEVKRFEQALQYYRIQAQVYETEYKASLAQLEIFRVEAEVAKLSNDINQTEVDIYTAQLNAQKTETEIFGIQVKAIESQIRAESAAVSAFGEEVSAYTAQINAKKAEFGAYESAISGNRVQADIYSTEVSAYNTRINANKTIIDVEIATSNAVIAYNKNLSDQFSLELNKYTTEIKAESTRFDSSTKAYIAQLQSFKAELDAKKVVLTGQAKEAELEVNAAISDYRNQSDFRVQWARINNEGSRNVAEVAMSGAKVYTDIAGAALESQNTMVQVVEN